MASSWVEGLFGFQKKLASNKTPVYKVEMDQRVPKACAREEVGLGIKAKKLQSLIKLFDEKETTRV